MPNIRGSAIDRPNSRRKLETTPANGRRGIDRNLTEPDGANNAHSGRRHHQGARRGVTRDRRDPVRPVVRVNRSTASVGAARSGDRWDGDPGDRRQASSSFLPHRFSTRAAGCDRRMVKGMRGEGGASEYAERHFVIVGNDY